MSSIPTKVLIWQAAGAGGTEIAKGNPMDGSGLGGIYLTRCGRWIKQAATRFLGSSVDWKALF